MEATVTEKLPGIKKEIELGKLVPAHISCFLKRYLSSNERALVASQTGVGYHTVDKVVLGSNPVTKGNYPGLVAAIKLAIKKADDEINDAKVAKKKLKSILA